MSDTRFFRHCQNKSGRGSRLIICTKVLMTYSLTYLLILLYIGKNIILTIYLSIIIVTYSTPLIHYPLVLFLQGLSGIPFYVFSHHITFESFVCRSPVSPPIGESCL